MTTATASPVIFIDTETTGLDAERHEIWEIGIIDGDDAHRWFLDVDLGRADPISLQIGGYHARHPHGYDFKDNGDFDNFVTETKDAAREVAEYTRGLTLIGANPAFDEQRLRRLLTRNGACPEWHYRPICVEVLAVGYLRGQHALGRDFALSTGSIHDAPEIVIPWKSNEISAMLGIDPSEYDRHSALGDCAWTKAIYDKVMGTDG